MLKNRIITIVIAIPILLWVIFYMPPLYFALLMAIVVAIGAWEWTTLVAYSNNTLRILYVITVIIGVFLAAWIPAIVLLSIACLVLLWGLVALLRFQCADSAFGFQYPGIKVIIGMMMLIPFWVSLMVLKTSSQLGPIWLLFAALIVWVADSAAYLAGKSCGKHKLIPKVSPNKTWEGLIGGVLAAFLVAFIFSLFMPLAWSQRAMLWLIALLAIIFSVVGDLQISLLKRLVGVKDTGQIFPGHGGMLDRIDSLTAGMIVFALGVLLAGL